MDKFFLLVAGTRTFNDYELLSKKIKQLTIRYGNNICIVSGGAKGADTLAEKYAKEHNLEFVKFPAQWDKYGKSAGFIRNEEMHHFIAQHKHRGCVLFWNGKSKGTKHNIGLSKIYKNQIRIIKYEDKGID